MLTTTSSSWLSSRFLISASKIRPCMNAYLSGGHKDMEAREEQILDGLAKNWRSKYFQVPRRGVAGSSWKRRPRSDLRSTNMKDRNVDDQITKAQGEKKKISIWPSSKARTFLSQKKRKNGRINWPSYPIPQHSMIPSLDVTQNLFLILFFAEIKETVGIRALKIKKAWEHKKKSLPKLTLTW